MNTFKELRSWLRKPHHTLSDTERTFRWWVDLVLHGVAELRRNRAQQMAAALTYRTLFSLLPTVVLMMTIVASFVSEAERDTFKKSLVNWVLAPIVQGDPVETEAPGSTPALDGGERRDAHDEGVERRRQFDEMRHNLATRIEEIIDNLASVNFRSISLVGILLFIYGATGLLTTIEGSFNTVYGAVHGRPPLIQLPIHYTVITLAPLVILGGQVLRRSFLGALEVGQWTNWLNGTMAVLTPFIAAWLLLCLLYALIPNTRVNFRMALTGSLVSAILLVVGNHFFSVYVRKAAFSTLYGALGLFPLFLFWLWVMWLIILFGLVLSYTLQGMTEGKFRHALSRSSDEIILAPTLVLPLATRIAEGFAAGQVVTVADLSRDLHLTERAVALLANALKTAGLIHQVRKKQLTAYTLAQPAENIRASDVLAAGDSLLAPHFEGRSSHAWNYVSRLKEGVRNETAKTTLADLCRPPASE